MPNSRHSPAICSPSSSLAMNFSHSSMGLHTFQGILRSPQKAQLCTPCLRNELSPLSQEGHLLYSAICALRLKLQVCLVRVSKHNLEENRRPVQIAQLDHSCFCAGS